MTTCENYYWLKIEYESTQSLEMKSRFVAQSEYNIGRGEENDFVYGDPSVSGDHCWLGRPREAGTAAVLTDTSRNGTWVNGVKIMKGTKYTLQYDDQVGIGGYGTEPSWTFFVRKPKA